MVRDAVSSPHGALLRALAAVALLVLGGCTTPAPPPLEWQPPVPLASGCTGAATADMATPLPVAVLNTSFGELRARLDAEAVPVTAGNFIDLARSGFYDGTRFHFAVQGFAMQGGDPLSRDDQPRNDGSGGPGYTIPEEHHHRLRHDARGVLTMAHHGPGTAGSQFLVTFAPLPHLDDRHAVFGRVVEGHDVLDRIEAQAADPVDERGNPLHGGTPREPIVLRSVRIEVPAAPEKAVPDLGLWSPDAIQHVPLEGGHAAFLVVAESCHARRTQVAVGTAGDLEPGFSDFVLPAAQRVAFIVTADVDAGVAANITLPVQMTHGNGSVLLDLTVTRGKGAAEADGLHYIGMLPDGRVFDASMDLDPQATWTTCCSGEGPHVPTSDSIQVLQDLAERVGAGTSAAARVAPEDAFGTGDHPLADRTLLFVAEGVKGNSF